MTPEEQAAADAAALAAKNEADAAAKAAADAEAAKAAEPPSPDTSKTPILMPPGAMKKLKEAERLRGQREYQAKLDDDAQELGYADHADMMATIRKNGKPVVDPEPKPTPVAPKTPNGDRKLQNRLEEEKKARQKAERVAREAGERNKALEARHALERKFMKAGITDTDYAVNLLEREMAAMTPEAAETFNPDEWVGNLKKSKAYLFGEARVVPADTSGGAGTTHPAQAGTPPPPKRDAAGNLLYPNALEVDPKTGKYTMSAQDADKMLRDIVRNADKGGAPVLEKNN